MEQQITTAEALTPGMRPGSLYIVEDTHTSYWPSTEADSSERGTFIEWAKLRADDVHGYHWSQEIPPTPWTDLISAVHVHDSIVVFDVGRSFAPFSEVVGSWDFLRLTQTSGCRAVGVDSDNGRSGSATRSRAGRHRRG